MGKEQCAEGPEFLTTDSHGLRPWKTADFFTANPPLLQQLWRTGWMDKDLHGFSQGKSSE